MTAEPCQGRAHARRGNAFWIVRGCSAPVRPFAVFLADGREAMSLFSSEDEARVFCPYGEEGTDTCAFEKPPQVRSFHYSSAPGVRST
jgi:hypothetical protein